MNTYLKHIGILLVMLWANCLLAQDEKLGTKVIDIIKPYSPSIQTVVKQQISTPNKDTTMVSKKKMNYTIFSVPVASVFIPERGKAMLIPPQEQSDKRPSYFTLAGGNYASIFADGYTHFSPNEVSNFFADMHHHSSQKGGKNTKTDSNFSNTKLSLGYRFSDEYYQAGASINFQHRLAHWYGLENPLFAHYAYLSLAQNYWTTGFRGYFGTTDTFLKRSDVSFQNVTDSYESNEQNIEITPSFEFALGKKAILLLLNSNFNYLKGNFEKDFDFSQGNSYQNFIVGLQPSFPFSIKNFDISAGFNFYYISATNSRKNFRILPNLDITYQGFSKNFLPFAGVKSDVKQNSYNKFSFENPFISPTLQIIPSATLYDVFLGAKGRIVNTISYNVKGSFSRTENLALFQENSSATQLKKRYHLDNSFTVLYDNATVFRILGTIGGEIFNQFSAVLLFNAQSYTMDNQKYAWNLPSLESSLSTSYQFSKWNFSSEIFYISERKSSLTQTLPSFFDVNLSTQYNFTKNWSAFVNLNNLTGKSYFRFSNYPTQGFQVLTGVKYQFNLNK